MGLEGVYRSMLRRLVACSNGWAVSALYSTITGNFALRTATRVVCPAVMSAFFLSSIGDMLSIYVWLFLFVLSLCLGADLNRVTREFQMDGDWEACVRVR